MRVSGNTHALPSQRGEGPGWGAGPTENSSLTPARAPLPLPTARSLCVKSSEAAFSLKVTDSRISPEVSCSSLRKENSCSPSSSSPKHLQRLKTIIKSFLCFFFSGRHPTSFPPWGLFPEPRCFKIPIAHAVLPPSSARTSEIPGALGRLASLTWSHCYGARQGHRQCPPTARC